MIKAKKLRCNYLENPAGIGGKPVFSWILESEDKAVLQTFCRIQVCRKGDGFLNPLWDSGKVRTDQSIHMGYKGPELESRSCCQYRVKIGDNKGNESDWSETGFFETGILDVKEFKAEFISADKNENPAFSSACPLFRKEFTTRGEIRSARIYATSRGLYELRLNGKRVGDLLFTPGWTSYNKRLQYQTYDVTSMLKEGSNAVGAILGNGWYKGYLAGWGEDSREKYGKRTALFFQMHITYADGSEQLVLSDTSWKTIDGPIMMSEIYNGETYDARKEAQGWDCPGFDASAWPGVCAVKADLSILTPQEGVPVKKIETVTPCGMLKTPAGETVLDMGQNMVGWVQFAVTGPAGSRVVLKHGEMLDRNGNFYAENLRSAKQTVEYILKGDEKECFEPHFTFQGFRYVKIEEFPGKPEIQNFTGVVIHSDLPVTGSFSCSNELVNRLQHNILWSQKGNFVDVPMDCPQRDERLGWTGDAQIYARTACFAMNAAPFYKKWLRDLKSDQHENGGVPFIVPDLELPKPEDKFSPWTLQHSSSGWGDAAVIIPWTVYLCFGDLKVLEEQYDSMKAWVGYIENQAEEGVIWNTGFHFGDWLALDAAEGSRFGATPNDLVSTAFYAYSASLLVRTASVLKRDEDEKRYRELHGRILAAFRKEFFRPDGQLKASTQTAYALVLAFGLVEEKYRKRTVDALVEKLREGNWHFTTGFLGTPYLCHVLSGNGYAEAAYKLLLQTDYPSWLYQVTKGATTIWEHMDGLKPDGSFWEDTMNSFNQYAYGSIGDWLYRAVAGIDIDEARPGYKHIIIHPQITEALDWASAGLETMYGLVKVKWRRSGEEIQMDITIPHNTTASVTLCNTSLELGSGEYSFSSRA